MLISKNAKVFKIAKEKLEADFLNLD
ncbi:hypothetical protein L5515_001213 [Caenorhabditis briggsae]|uniref:Uncharacterized protein n=1 Tax=Caenorhabditis briggsae TaxID=6238 RepID=A0AAE9E484_CAEBR|nr:hypothetical protein L5515_001213 [Caenorhabditis briggsae]